MTQLLERAFAEAAKLPAKDQDAFATLFLEELESEKRWDAAFAASGEELSRLAHAALAEDKAGETEPMNLDRDFTHD